MAISKIKCTGCKRQYLDTEPVCPFCGNSNPRFAQEPYVAHQLDSAPLSVEDIMGSDDEEYIPPQIQNEPAQPAQPVKSEPEYHQTSPQPDENAGLFNSTNQRAPIAWTDEPAKQEPDYSKMYDSGLYNPNFDGFYDDTLPRIKDEVDNLLKGREKAILKGIGGIVMIIGIIVYLVLTLNV